MDSVVMARIRGVAGRGKIKSEQRVKTKKLKIDDIMYPQRGWIERIFDLSTIEELKLEDCNLTDEYLSKFLTNLRVLKYSKSYKLASTKIDCVPLIATVLACPKLTTWTLERIPISVRDVDEKILRKFKTVDYEYDNKTWRSRSRLHLILQIDGHATPVDIYIVSLVSFFKGKSEHGYLKLDTGDEWSDLYGLMKFVQETKAIVYPKKNPGYLSMEDLFNSDQANKISHRLNIPTDTLHNFLTGNYFFM